MTGPPLRAELEQQICNAGVLKTNKSVLIFPAILQQVYFPRIFPVSDSCVLSDQQKQNHHTKRFDKYLSTNTACEKGKDKVKSFQMADWGNMCRHI